ncbi:MAG: M50 family metallopeptidase, partial [Nitratireductor sp.]|nr:M50 family metallopeptidase [Nitratireductor sp.]
MEFLTQLPGAGLFSYILPFLVVLTIVVFFHELGHFLVARWNGVKVDAFSIGFGPEIWGFDDRHGTRWKLSAIPLGGYVKFFGDANAASAPDFEQAQEMTEAEKSVSFLHKKVWQRAAIVAAGPAANFILAIVIFALTFMLIGRAISDPVATGVEPGGAAAEAGIQAGDIVRAIDGEPIRSFTQIPRIVAPNPNRPLAFTIERDGRTVELTVTPKLEERTDQFGNKQEIGFIGLSN